MNKFLLLFFLTLGFFFCQAQIVGECSEQRVYPATSYEKCETKVVIIGCVQDSVVIFYRNAYTADTIIGNKICKVEYPALIKKEAVLVPEYRTIRTCEVNAKGAVIRQVFVDCPDRK